MTYRGRLVVTIGASIFSILSNTFFLELAEEAKFALAPNLPNSGKDADIGEDMTMEHTMSY